MWFQQSDAFTLVQFRLEWGPDHLLKRFERSGFISVSCVSEGIYTWSFQDPIAIWSEKTHEVTRCKHPNVSCNVTRYTLRVGTSRHLTIRFTYDSEDCNAIIRWLSMMHLMLFFSVQDFFSQCETTWYFQSKSFLMDHNKYTSSIFYC